MTTATAPAKTTDAPPARIAKPPTELSKLKGWLESPAFSDAIAKALPTHLKPERFIRVAITATMKTPKLLQCTQESMFECLLRLSEAGLEPDGRRAHLIPRDVRQKVGNDWKVVRTDCTLVLDYKGLAELVMRSGLVSNIHADVVCENDDFEYDKGFIVRHRIDFRKPRGKAYAAYAVVRFKDGTEKSEVMQESEILAIRDRSDGWKAFTAKRANQSPWNPAEPTIAYEMWKKTAFRRVSKWVPLSPEIRSVVEADDDLDDDRPSGGQFTNIIDSTATTQSSTSDALADMLQQRMQESSGDHGSSEPGEPTGGGDQEPEPSMQQGSTPTETEAATETPVEEAPTFESLLSLVAAATRISELHEINELGKRWLVPEDWDKLGIALHEHQQLIEAQKQEQAAAAGKKKDGKLI